MVLQTAASEDRGGKPIDDQEAYDEAHFAFRAARYQVLYDRWLRDGDAALDVVSSPATADAIKCGAGRTEYHVLPFSYRHLSPLLVAATRPTMKGAEEGDNTPALPRPPLATAITTTIGGADSNQTVGA